MSTLSLDIPNSLHQQIRALGEKECNPVPDFISMALIEKVATLETAD